MSAFTIIDADQRSPEWFQARCGRLTGSKADVIFAKGKGGGEAVTRRDYKLQLACERLTGAPQDDVYVNSAMQRGIDEEPAALAAYEVQTGNMVRKTGFLAHVIHLAGCSLDGSIDEFTGILELKNPKTATHLSYIRNPGTLAEAYHWQAQHNLWVTGAEWCDVVSFDSRLPKMLQLHIERVKPDGTYEPAALQFLSEVAAEVDAIKALRG